MRNMTILIFCISMLVIAYSIFSSKIQTDLPLETLLEKSVQYVGAPYPHNLGFYGKGVKIAIIDTGVDSEHPDLNGRIIGRSEEHTSELQSH